MLISTKNFALLVSLLAATSLDASASEVKFKIGPKAEVARYRYYDDEGDPLKISGVLYGLSSELDVLFDGGFRLFPSFDIAVGKTTHKYRGESRGSRTHINGAVGEARLPVGYNFIQTPESTLTGFSGLGYRQLSSKYRDENSSTTWTNQYTYVPVGLAYRATIGEKTALELRGEYDRLVRNTLTLTLRDEDGTERDRIRGNKGNGARVQATLEKTLRDTTLFASATYQYWKIQRAEDTSSTLGLTLGLAL